MSRYACAFNGTCEPNPNGAYESLEDCQKECASISNKDVQDLIYQYSPYEALQLAPSDQQRIINRLTRIANFGGLSVSPDEAPAVLQALEAMPSTGVSALASVPATWPYMESLYTEEEVVNAFYDLGNMSSYRRLLELYDSEAIDYNRLYRSSLKNGHCDVADQLALLPSSSLELTDEEVMDALHIPHDCILRHIIELYASFDEYFSAESVAELAATSNDVDLFLRLIRLYGSSRLMNVAATDGGLPFLKQLALHNYYQTVDRAAKFGLPFINLALENYDEDPNTAEIERALEVVKDQDACDFLHSLMGDEGDCSNSA
jgi:hypothetical protein